MSATTTVDSANSQDAAGNGQIGTEAEAAAFLAARLGSDVTLVTRLGHGEWSRAFAYRHAGRDYVARFSALREDFDKDRRAMRYATPALAIPRIVEVSAAPGGFYAISERAPGTYLDALDEPQLRAVLPALFAALDAVRLADLSDSTGYGGWGADGIGSQSTWPEALLAVGSDPPESRTHGWRERLATSPTGAHAFDEALAALGSLLAYAPAERHLIHSDLLNYNVLVAGDRLTAVIDWGCAMYGDFLYDVAWLDFWSSWYPAWRGIDFAAEAQRHYESIGLAVPHFAERLRCCELHIGLGGIAYSAFRGRRAEVESNARRTLAIARRH